MTITSTAPVLSSSGISAPTYAEILDYLQVGYRGIYGEDIYLENDSQDGQFLAIVAAAIRDANSVTIAVYNSFSPVNAQGNSLSSNVKLNGIQRQVPTNSTVPMLVSGTAGVAVINGIVQDAAKNNWALPSTVNIPGGGEITVTATCQTVGAVTAITGGISQIITPQLGWQSAINTGPATPGAPVESDAALRRRQAVSVAQPGQGPLVTVIGAVASVSGVTRYQGYENPTNATDSNSLPPHSLSMVVEGGDSTLIATAIANHKTVGALTNGTTTVIVPTQYGIPESISYYPVIPKRISVAVGLKPINGYTSDIGVEIQQAMVDYINAIPIGSNVLYTRLFNPANLFGTVDGLTYEIITLGVSIYPATPGTADVVIGFDEVAHCELVDVTITIIP